MSSAWRAEFGDDAKRQLRALDPVVVRRLLSFLRDRVLTSEDPRRLGIALRGKSFAELWRYRIGDYRLIVAIEDETRRLLVVKVGHRRDIYG